MLAEAVLLFKLVIFIGITDGYAVIGETEYGYPSQALCEADGKEVVVELKQQFPLDNFYAVCEARTQ